ncbi:MAG: Holliday junction resolvase RuvX [Erysipelotrichaceae bacterium]|nr:Holliday junction resolvase RuvX [Erysipelotrichaceae bacterium]MBQ7889261.1 Holliday junction resolvase RuvX [Erysipelotrichaceae bacterium]
MERVLGLDLGSRTLGVAVSDPLGMIARTVETFRFEEDDYDAALKRTGELIKEYSAKRIVLGLPKHMNGDIGIRGEISIQFKASLEEMFNIPVELVDERLTTVVAQKMLISADVSRKKRKKVVDQIAAVQILQGYLDRKH